MDWLTFRAVTRIFVLEALAVAILAVPGLSNRQKVGSSQ